MSEPVEVYSAANKVDASAALTELRSQGIDAQVICELRQRQIDGLPAVWESSPQIRTLACYADAAREVIAAWIRKRQVQSDFQPACGWTCPKCDTAIEAEFDVCWNCLYNPSAC